MAGREQDPVPEGLGHRPFARGLLAIAAAVGLAVLYAAFVEPQLVSLERVDVVLPGLPPDLDGFKILQVSDLESRGRGRREERVARLAREASADVVVSTGDLVAKTLRGAPRAEAAGEAAALLGEIPTRHGAWFVEGHGEQLRDADRRALLQALDRRGVHFLRDDIAVIPVGSSSLALVGLGLHPDERATSYAQRPDGAIVETRSGRRDAFLNLAPAGGGSLERMSDYEFSGQFRFSREESGLGLTFYNRMPDREDRFYRLSRTESNASMHLSPHGTVFTLGRSSSGFAPSPGPWHAFRVRLEADGTGTRVRARIWPADDPEPEAWSVDCLDATPTRITSGTVGIWTSGPGRKEFRGLTVVRHDGSILVEEGRPEGMGQGTWRPPEAPDWMLSVAERLPAGSYPVALAHTPDVFPYTTALGWPLLLAGHTQGGQIRLPLVGALVTDTKLGRSYSAGLYERDGSQLYITRGVGTSRVPLRFLSPPEITLITLRAAPIDRRAGSAS